ncbi:MAG TPA: BON domain-containing protein [Pirellulales bacterium]|nr:BON domain-containing protein [Pirellulales bacterium]
MLWPICASAESPTNDKVAHQIHDRLKASGQMSGSSFVIKFQDGTAWLEGRVSSEGQKLLALKLTGEVPDVTDVVDHLQIDEPAKSANPVMRLLQKPFAKATAKPVASAPAATEKKRTISSWFSGPSVHAAKVPPPELEDLGSDSGEELAQDGGESEAEDVGPVYPESLTAAKETESNPLVRQAANLRAIFHKTPKAPQRSPANKAVAANEVNQTSEAEEANQSEPRPMPQAMRKCTTCTPAAAHRTTAPTRVVSNKKRYRSPVPVYQAASQAQPTAAGRVRMVPMMEMPDGRLVPVNEEDRPAMSQPVRQAVAVSRGKTAKRTRQTVARKQDVIDGGLEAPPLPPFGAAPVAGPAGGGPLPAYVPGVAVGTAPAYYDQPHMPNYAWPSYAAHPNYAGLTYPRQYSPTAWPYIGPFYPYPQVPLGWRKVTLEWDDGWWFLDFDDCNRSYSY